MAGYKKPKSVDFISASEMLRATTGKILQKNYEKDTPNKEIEGSSYIAS